MDKKHRILNYWYNMELFAPYWPEKTKDTFSIYRANSKMPWIEMEETKYNYDVYLGKIKTHSLIQSMLLSIDKIEEVIEKDASETCICALKIDSDGTYICNSFSISTFIWAVAKITAKKNLKTNLDLKEVDKINSEMNDILLSFEHKLDQKDLERIHSAVLEKILLKSAEVHFYAVINRSYIKKENDSIETGTGMLSSFYVSDIDMIRRKIQNGDSIVKYIEALWASAVNRIEIDNDVFQMKKWLLPEKYPLGKWPSIVSPNLMQQISINMGISEEEAIRTHFSVNGPPGTGKTTLLKEIIASYIVERSILLCKYQNPDDAFTRCQFNHSEDGHLKYYYQPESVLKKYGILVASDNNEVAENISKELSIANDFMGYDEECWGFISAMLGNKSNTNTSKQVLWFQKDGVNLQQLNKQELPDWKHAKEVFYHKYQEVLQYRMKIQEAVRNTVEHYLIMQEYENTKTQLNIITKERIDQQNFMDEVVSEKNGIQSQMEALEKNADLLHQRLGSWKRLFSFLFKKDPLIQELKQLKQKLDVVVIRYTELNAKFSALQLLIDKTEIDYKKACRCFKENKIMLQNSCEQIEKYREQFGANYAGEEFWLEIQKNENSQAACPWTNKEYDTLREELFHYGLMLHKAFIINSKSVKQNMNCLVDMWGGNFSEADKAAGFTHLINTLFFVVPVISITFASVSTFLKYADKNELGTLIIDEAGQAAPYSALGAIWRTCKAIVVGDPLQLEPMVSVPKELSERFADEFDIEPSYRLHELSVQMLADSMNPYGGYREYASGNMWVGCPFVIHRKCRNPMFLISNQIAYNNRMFIKSMGSKANVPLLMNQSIWLNIKGKENGDNDHFVPEQGVKAMEMVIHAFEIQNGFPSLYIISPFISIAANLKAILRIELHRYFPDYDEVSLNEWIENSCGTVHTIQGKEANEVIIILGCDDKSGAGAAQWAGKTPNILNVAMTRAKYRIAVIGDGNIWGKVSGFDFVYKILSNGCH